MTTVKYTGDEEGDQRTLADVPEMRPHVVTDQYNTKKLAFVRKGTAYFYTDGWSTIKESNDLENYTVIREAEVITFR